VALAPIRAGRTLPRLLRQHYTCVLAAQQACNAKVSGLELGSTSLEFIPGNIQAGQFDFAIGTAGSTILVAQTLLPILAKADGPSTVTFKGGTHNDLAPSLCFFQRSFLPLLEQMGLDCKIELYSVGFNPAGGGFWQLTVNPCHELKPLELTQPAADFVAQSTVTALLSELPDNIGQREVDKVVKLLDWDLTQGQVKHVPSPGPGNSLQLSINCNGFENLIEHYGQRGVRAEDIAKRSVKQFKRLLQSGGAVEKHLADQLLLPMALAGKGKFTTTKPTLHTETNIEVIKQFLAVNINIEPQSEFLWQIDIG
jgi:RNA 3'-terminal phosphate cyclase (ATP)